MGNDQNEVDAITAFLANADRSDREPSPLDSELPENAPQVDHSRDTDDATSALVDQASVVDMYADAQEQVDLRHFDEPARVQDAEAESPVIVEETDRIDHVESDAAADRKAGTAAAGGIGAVLASIFLRPKPKHGSAASASSLSANQDEGTGASDVSEQKENATGKKRVPAQKVALMVVVVLIAAAGVLTRNRSSDADSTPIQVPTLTEAGDSLKPDPDVYTQRDDVKVEMPDSTAVPDQRLVDVDIGESLDLSTPPTFTPMAAAADSGDRAGIAAGAWSNAQAPGTSASAASAPSEVVPATAAPAGPTPADDAAGSALAAAAGGVPPAEDGATPAVQLVALSPPAEPSVPTATPAAPSAPPEVAIAPPAPTPAPKPKARAVQRVRAGDNGRPPKVRVLGVMSAQDCWSCGSSAILASNEETATVNHGDTWNGYRVSIAGDRVTLSAGKGQWSFLPEQ